MFTKRKFTLKEKLALIRNLPEQYDLCFYDDLPLHLKKIVISEGKVLFTRDYYKFFKEMRYVELEYPRYAMFLKEYQQRLAEI